MFDPFLLLKQDWGVGLGMVGPRRSGLDQGVGVGLVLCLDWICFWFGVITTRVRLVCNKNNTRTIFVISEFVGTDHGTFPK